MITLHTATTGEAVGATVMNSPPPRGRHMVADIGEEVSPPGAPLLEEGSCQVGHI